MKTNHYLILGGVALVAAYLWYRHEKSATDKAEDKKEKLAKDTTPVVAEETSNFQGTACRCDNGRTGFCQSGDCSRCCGQFGYKKMGRN
jgi:hypothetical protein